ncbi:MAG: CheR family methyltransferase [Methanomicrobiales archaeon]|nr:CheR family methyltransferase [Methanomicrobiales archaeon]
MMRNEKQDGETPEPAGEPERDADRWEQPAAESPALPRAIVGIGASAGGLEALEQFFRHTPTDTGLAFVVILHQDPRQKGLLPEILERFTSLPVVEASDGTRVEPDTVYIKPSHADLAILQGVLTLLEPLQVKGLHLPIDTFFRHLAEDQDGKAIGIVLSGTGSDGTLGIRALKERTGMAMAQDPATAQFTGMPQSAIATGLVDYVAPPAELPKLLIPYIQSLEQISAVREVPDKATEDGLAKIFVLLRSRTGQDFSQYKRSTIQRRIGRRMSLHQLTRLEDYIRFLQENPPEIEVLAKELLIGVTRFFRDPEAWENLKDVLSGLIRRAPEGSTLRVWVAGCSSGEEAYTMAIAIREVLDALDRSREIRFQIFGTDVDGEAIETARHGVYPANIAVDVSPERLDRFFVKEDERYRVTQEIRETVIFAPHNVISDPPFTHLDVLSCRNLLIYLTPSLQKKLIPLFHYALEPGGILFLGTAESIGSYGDLFKTVESRWKIFQRREETPAYAAHPELPLQITAPERHAGRVLAKREVSAPAPAQKWLLERFVPPSVIVNERGDILYFQGKTRKYLEPPTGRAILNVFTMAREGLSYPLAASLTAAVREKKEIARDDVSVRINGTFQRIRLTVQPIPETDEKEQLYLVSFEDRPETIELPARETAGEGEEACGRCAALEQELVHARQQLQNFAEEMQASQEELRSANEELQSMNEELTSSKEELQSLNEELLTVNAEHQKKIEELSRSSDDMRNALRSAEIPLLFLNNELRVRRFTEPIRSIINLQPSDIGRPVTDLKVNIRNERFQADVREVLDTLQMRAKQVQTGDGRWYTMRILPYRTGENRIEGVIVAFSDITPLKELESSLQYFRTYAENVVATVCEPLLVLDRDLRVVAANRSFYTTFRVKPEETVGKLLYTLGNNQWDIPELRELLEEILPKQTEFEGYEVEHDFPGIGHRVMRLNARKVQSDAGPSLILLAMEVVSGRSGAEGGHAGVQERSD